MDDYRILVQDNPQSSDIPPFCQNGFLFNERAHLRQQNDGRFHLLIAVNQTTRQAEARCAFFIRSGAAISPGAAPFGSIEFAETLPDHVLDKFLTALTEVIRSAHLATIRVVNYPHCYAPKQAHRLTTKLFQHGFRLLETNQNFYLPITNTVFEQTIASAERRRLGKCRKANFLFTHWQAPNLEQVLNFVQETREQKGYPLTIKPDQLIDLLTNFPNHFSVFAVIDGPAISALTIAVRVHDDILYNFLPVSNPAYQSFSPMVMLTDGLVTYCRQQQIRLLDLGVSLDHNRQPKPGLMRFKRNLGAQESPKLVFEKTW